MSVLDRVRSGGTSTVLTNTSSVGETVPCRVILGTRVHATSYAHLRNLIAGWIAMNRGAYVCVSTVHSLMESHDDESFRLVMNRADLVTPDGMPLVWGLRLLGVPGATRVYGPTITETMCSWAAANGVPVGFYGSTIEVVDRLVRNLTKRYPALQVAFRHSPPFRPVNTGERQQELQAIQASGARILFVGLGCPKQERWMSERRDDLDVVMVGVGAAFDYLAGTIRRPRPLVQQLGFEWLFRLLHEPRRLWRRYAWNNPRFVILFVRQLIRTRLAGERI